MKWLNKLRLLLVYFCVCFTVNHTWAIAVICDGLQKDFVVYVTTAHSLVNDHCCLHRASQETERSPCTHVKAVCVYFETKKPICGLCGKKRHCPWKYPKIFKADLEQCKRMWRMLDCVCVVSLWNTILTPTYLNTTILIDSTIIFCAKRKLLLGQYFQL